MNRICGIISFIRCESMIKYPEKGIDRFSGNVFLCTIILFTIKLNEKWEKLLKN